MVSLDQLAALDLQLWLTASQRAARLEQTNQSTIVRRGQAAAACFGVTIRRDPGGWDLEGDSQLLQLERRLHQQARLLGRRPLRLQAPYWTQQTHLRRLPQGWCTNPPADSLVCENPIALLRSRVIDAALLTPTQIPPQHDDLVCLDLYANTIELSLFPEAGIDDPLLAYRQLRDQGLLLLRQPAFLPNSYLQCCREWFAALGQSPDSAPAAGGLAAGIDPTDVSVAFLTPEMRRVQGMPVLVDGEIEARPYIERLVILADLASEPAVLRLQEHLASLFGSCSGRAAAPQLRAA